MTISRLTSRDNPLFKRIRLVASGSRKAPKQFVIAEGVRVLEEVRSAACAIEAAVISNVFGTVPREKILLEAWQSEKIRIYRTSEKLLESISSVRAPQGAVALVRIPERSLGEFEPPRNALIIYACGIQDPGNLGTLIRTAAAAGASMVCSSKGTVSARRPKTIRSSAGALFRIPIFEQVEVPDFCSYCESHSIRTYRTDAREGVSYMETDLKSSCALVLGNESIGVSDKTFAGFPAIRIPMAEGVDSLNVAIAGAIILFEAFKQRRDY
jgi:TrmH family RNA methyltransferase